MAISGNGEPEAGQEMNLAHEVPSPGVHEEPLERIEIEAGAWDFTGRISLWVKGRLLSTAQLLALTVVTAIAVLTTWLICHFEGLHSGYTLGSSAVIGLFVSWAGRVFLRR